MAVLNGLAVSAGIALVPGVAFGAGGSRSFDDAPSWQFNCTLDALARADGWCVAPNAENACGMAATVTWHRDRGVATMIWQDGNGKELREVEGFSGTGQQAVHFWFSPATEKFTGSETAASRYGGWIEDFGPTFVSLRITGEAAMTTHDIVFGGMKALSREGRCTVRAIGPEGEE